MLRVKEYVLKPSSRRSNAILIFVGYSSCYVICGFTEVSEKYFASMFRVKSM
jgi:hypothetical protein